LLFGRLSEGGEVTVDVNEQEEIQLAFAAELEPA
jgi:hypothetical protein